MAPRRSPKKTATEKSPAVRVVPVGIQLALVAIILLGGVSLWAGRDQVSAFVSGLSGQKAQSGKSRKGGKGVPAVVARVTEQRDDAVVGAIGTGRAQRSVMLYAQASGEIENLLVAAGDKVGKGEALAYLDSREAQLAVKVARTRLIEAERLLTRAEQLRQKNVSSQANVDDARNVVERAELELEQAEEALSDREVRAPFSGVIGIPKVEQGDRVSDTTDMMTLDDRSYLKVEFQVPEHFLSRLDAGQNIEARTPGFPDQDFAGQIEYIDSRIDPASRSVMVRAKVPNAEDKLRPGMSFVVDLTIPGPVLPAVPELALQWRKGQSYVWRVRDGKAERVNLRSVRRLNSVILVEGDIAKGDLVVVEGVHRMRNGRKVLYRPPEPAPGS